VQTFIARQPIFDQRQLVYGYELFFRSSSNNICNHTDLDQASYKVIADCCSLLGTEAITSGKPAFINVTREVLTQEYILLLPPELTVVEILETVEPEPEVIAACRRLKQAGYLLALDDFTPNERTQPLVELADIIKVDVGAVSQREQISLIERLSRQRLKFAAEKVETHQAFQDAVKLGYDYFQGYFFCKPMMMTMPDVPGFKLNYFQILQEIHRPELSWEQIEAIIKRDLSLFYKFLRFVNSASFGWRKEIDSIRHALLLLGEQQIKKWASLVTLACLGQDKPGELVVQATIRARFCETLAPRCGLAHRAEELFLLGMLSLIDAIMDRPLGEILKDIPITEDIKAALLGEENQLREVYESVLAYEEGNWEKLAPYTAKLGIDESEVPQLYLEAVTWVQQDLQKAL
jgi:c-di-GMP-related signal transduction protein